MLAHISPRLTWVLAILAAGVTQGADSDRFDGALWKFTMSPKKSATDQQPLTGLFRCSKHVLYQKSKPDSADFDKVIGKNHPRGKSTRIEMEDYRGMDQGKKWHQGMKGAVLLEMDRFGEWSGTFIDAKGSHWDFHCTRIQE